VKVIFHREGHEKHEVRNFKFPIPLCPSCSSWWTKRSGRHRWFTGRLEDPKSTEALRQHWDADFNV